MHRSTAARARISKRASFRSPTCATSPLLPANRKRLAGSKSCLKISPIGTSNPITRLTVQRVAKAVTRFLVQLPFTVQPVFLSLLRIIQAPYWKISLMNKQALIDGLLASKANQIRNPGLSMLGDNPHLLVTELHELCYDASHPQLAFRAAWLLEYIAVHHPDRFLPV